MGWSYHQRRLRERWSGYGQSTAAEGCGARAVEVIVDAKSACEGGCGDGIVIKMDITRDGFDGDSEARMGPGSIGERGEGSGGGTGMVVDLNVAFVCTNAKFVDDGLMSRDVEIVLDNRVEGGGGGCSYIRTGVATVGMHGQCWGRDG